MRKIVPVFPWPMPVKLAEALARIDGITPVEALPGGPGPILAIKTPTFVCDALIVKDPKRIPDAVSVITADGIELVSMREQVGAIMGQEVSETIESRIAKVRFQ